MTQAIEMIGAGDGARTRDLRRDRPKARELISKSCSEKKPSLCRWFSERVLASLLVVVLTTATAFAQTSIVYHRAQNGATIAGSQAALKDAILAGRKISLVADAIDSYFEVLPATVAGFDHAANRSFMMTTLPAHAGSPGAGDTFAADSYNMSVVFLDDGRSFHHRQALLGSTWTGNRGSSAAWNRYGYYRWVAAGAARAVIANSNDPASMIAFAQNYLAGSVSDVMFRITVRNPNTGQPQMTWVAPATSIFYVAKRAGEPGADTWLMSWPVTDPTKPNWTVKLPNLVVPSAGDPRTASWANPSFMTVVQAIAHSGGYVTMQGLPTDLTGQFIPTGVVNHAWVAPGTLIEVLQ